MNRLSENAAMTSPAVNKNQIKLSVPEGRLKALEESWTNITEQIKGMQLQVHFNPVTKMLVLSTTPETRYTEYLDIAGESLKAFINGFEFEDALCVFQA